MTAGTSSCSPVSSIPSTGQGGSQWKQTSKQNRKNLATQESLQRRENSAPQWPGWAGALQGLAIWRSAETGQRAREGNVRGDRKQVAFLFLKLELGFHFLLTWMRLYQGTYSLGSWIFYWRTWALPLSSGHHGYSLSHANCLRWWWSYNSDLSREGIPWGGLFLAPIGNNCFSPQNSAFPEGHFPVK